MALLMPLMRLKPVMLLKLLMLQSQLPMAHDRSESVPSSW